MVSLVRGGISQFSKWIPNPIHRRIALSCGVFALAFRLIPRGRDDLALNYIDTPSHRQEFAEAFILNNIYSSKTESEKQSLLWKGPLYEVIHRVITAVTCLLTINVSLYASLTYICSQSNKVSRVALPLLDRIAHFPLPSLVRSPSAIVLGPVILNTLYITLVSLFPAPKERHPIINNLITALDQFSQMCDAALHLRLALICLGSCGGNLRKFISSTGFWLAIDWYLQQKWTVLAICPRPFAPLVTAYFEWLSHLLPFLKFNMMLTEYLWISEGLAIGMNNFWQTIRGYNLQEVWSLFHDVQLVSGEEKIPNRSFGVFSFYCLKVQLEQTENDISQALNERQITSFQAKQLHQLLTEKKHEILRKKLCQQDDDPISSSDLDESSILAQIYAPKNILDRFKEWVKDPHSSKWSLFYTGIKNIQNLFKLNSVPLPKDNSCDEHYTRLKNLPSFINELMSVENDEQMVFIKKTLLTTLQYLYWGQISTFFLHLRNIDSPTELQLKNHEEFINKALLPIYGNDVLMTSLNPALDKANAIISSHLTCELFLTNLYRYIQNYSKLDSNQREKIEYNLSFYAAKSSFQDFRKKDICLESTKDNPYRMVAREFLKVIDNLPEGFQFCTYNLFHEIIVKVDTSFGDELKKLLAKHAPPSFFTQRERKESPLLIINESEPLFRFIPITSSDMKNSSD